MWDFGDSTSSNLASPSHTYAQRGTYNVRLVVSAPGGCTDTTFDEIIVNPEFTLYVPNAFTPNGDGLNDNFLIYGEEIQEMNMMIFDRWGNMVFTSTSVQEGWDGRANGGADIAQQDVYVYKIQVKDLAGKQHKQTGHVSLIR
jgi:gliding motility-associated-like protein